MKRHYFDKPSRDLKVVGLCIWDALMLPSGEGGCRSNRFKVGAQKERGVCSDRNRDPGW